MTSENGALDMRVKRGLWITLVLAVIGLGFSAELLYVHLTVATEPGRDLSCRINQAVDCGAVAMSRQAEFLKVPVPVWAIAAYLLFLAFAWAGLKRKDQPPNLPDYILPLALWSAGYSAYLAYVSFFVLKTLCLYCAGLYAVNLLLLPAGFMAAAPLGQWPRRVIADLRFLKERPVELGALAFVLILSAGGLAALNLSGGEDMGVDYFDASVLDLSGDPAIGPADAPITIIEFSDFECPFCARMHLQIMVLSEMFEGKIRSIHKNYPLSVKCNPYVDSNMHPFACLAAEAAECAFQMGKYEEFTTKLWKLRYEGGAIDESVINRIAEEEGLDRAAFLACRKSPETKQKIRDDIEAGEKVMVEATPTFIINNYKFDGARDFSESRKLIRLLLRGEKLKVRKK